ncbi:MAG: S-adenosylmethionine:tRNA ribosyltransferase-isomerase [Bacteroidales bacterium]|jgi:S-adenosylmethionine:tRNA ribosyltransferase-isomerase|nr:S-adenosylmethionine:tRNA ribosyltransferase-isomerase [Bacteroidales bacterium]
MIDPDLIRIEDFDYPLPEDRIAQFPLAERDESRLLVSRDGIISETVFSEIDRFLPSDSLLIFNDTKVIRARLIFINPTGAKIEIFCLEPLSPVAEVETAFKQTMGCTWKCLIGNKKRWRIGFLQMTFGEAANTGILNANCIQHFDDGSFAIAFHWEPAEKTFSEILDVAGIVPLPPYIHRQTIPADAGRYQTIYAAHEGSVAAPTAGLHFTENVLNKIKHHDCVFDRVTLHVGVGTFRPVSTPTIRGHVMHPEKIVVSRQTVEQILDYLDRSIIAVGTTSARTIESLYWLGVKILQGEDREDPEVLQWDPYQNPDQPNVNPRKSLTALLSFFNRHQLNEYHGETQLMILPGYEYKLLSGLITNFHMPQSTLLLLVAAMIGEDWKKIYQYALENNFRFLSYGDCCLFFKQSR